MSSTAIRQSATWRNQLGLAIVAAAAVLIVVLGLSAGAPLTGVGIAAVLVVGSSLVGSGGEPLTARSASMMSSIHLVAVILLTL